MTKLALANCKQAPPIGERAYIRAKATIRHLAIVAKDLKELTEHQKRVFGLKEVRIDNKIKKQSGKIDARLTGGYLLLAILPPRLVGKNCPAIDNFRFYIDRINEGAAT